MKVTGWAALVVAVAIVHWLHKRIERVEQVSGAWRVQEPGQPPWADEAWWASDAFDRALADWQRQHPEGGAA